MVTKVYKYDNFVPMVDKVVDASWPKAVKKHQFTNTKGKMTF